MGRGKQGNLTPEPHHNTGGTHNLCHLAGELPEKPSLQAAAVFALFRNTDAQTAPSGSVSPVLLPGVQLLCLRSAPAPCSDVILGMIAGSTAKLWEKDVWRRLDADPLCLGLHLLVFTGTYSRDGSTWPCAMLTLLDGLPCPTLELPLHHGGCLNLVILISLTVYGFHCSKFLICCVSKRTFSLQGNSKSLELNCV